ncbi:MAG TPA: hypothetical protein DDW78_10050 [Treponema sp.]|nr:hypothetical protein [Treponema sp.]
MESNAVLRKIVFFILYLFIICPVRNPGGLRIGKMHFPDSSITFKLQAFAPPLPTGYTLV